MFMTRDQASYAMEMKVITCILCISALYENDVIKIEFNKLGYVTDKNHQIASNWAKWITGVTLANRRECPWKNGKYELNWDYI